MSHVTTEQLIDLAEGAQAESSAPHLQSCGSCRQQLAELRAMMSAVAEIEAPEPSPLFWDHLSARVHDAVDAEHGSGAGLAGGGRAAGATIAAWLRMRPALVGAFAVLVAAVAGALVGALVGAGVLTLQMARPASDVTPAASVAEAADLASGLTPVADDPSLALVADLAAGLDWEAARAVGLITHVGASDDAVNQLTAGERRELRQLLQGELSHARRGA